MKSSLSVGPKPRRSFRGFSTSTIRNGGTSRSDQIWYCSVRGQVDTIKPLGTAANCASVASQKRRFPNEAVIQQLYIHQFWDVFIFILLNQHANDLHQRGQGMIIILAYHVDQIVQDSHQPLIFTFRVRDEYKRCQPGPNILSRLYFCCNCLFLPFPAIVFLMRKYCTNVNSLPVVVDRREKTHSRSYRHARWAAMKSSLSVSPRPGSSPM